MFLYISFFIALISGLVQPFCSRLHATGLWAGKALVPPEAASAYPQGIQDALTDGWPSSVGLIGAILPFIALIIGFLHAWWVGILALFLSLFIAVFAKRLPIAAKTVDRYLAILLDHANRRGADYALKGDEQRAEVAHDIGQQLEDLLSLYLDSGIHAPTVKEARQAPFGDPEFLYQTREF